MLDRARHLGVNLIDTAECYGDHVSESLVGQAIAGCKSVAQLEANVTAADLAVIG